jgi:hypothetical protein
MSGNKFRTALIAMAPDADPVQHRCAVETSIYRLTTVLVKNEDEAVKVCQDLVRKDGVQSFILCPGFTSKGVARVAEALVRRCPPMWPEGTPPATPSLARP